MTMEEKELLLSYGKMCMKANDEHLSEMLRNEIENTVGSTQFFLSPTFHSSRYVWHMYVCTAVARVNLNECIPESFWTSYAYCTNLHDDVKWCSNEQCDGNGMETYPALLCICYATLAGCWLLAAVKSLDQWRVSLYTEWDAFTRAQLFWHASVVRCSLVTLIRKQVGLAFC